MNDSGSLMRRFIQIIIAITFIVVVGVIFLEAGVRGYFFVKNMVVKRANNSENYFGWKTAENINRETGVRGYGKIKFSTTRDGFRVFGDVDTKKKKIFVLGDSFTEGHTVSDGMTYYDYLWKNHENIEIFAYGCGGYGSLQEYMILDRYFDIIKPDIVIWQFHKNDLINNNYFLESASFINNNRMVRPYLKNGKIEWLFPRQGYGWIHRLSRYSYLLKLINIRLEKEKVMKVGSVEYKVTRGNKDFDATVATTDEIMGMVRERVGKTPVIAFRAGGWQSNWPPEIFPEICKKHNIFYLPGVQDFLSTAQKKGYTVNGTPHDSHWNNTGHTIAGKYILDILIKSGLLR